MPRFRSFFHAPGALRRELARRPVALGVLVVAFGVLHLAGIVRADEITRRLQEELRRRNLFFGEIDGRASAQLAAALRRYQERKGLASTGEVDADTLHSLDVLRPGQTPPPRPAAGMEGPRAPGTDPRAALPMAGAPGPEGMSWPDVSVLRSDAARPSPPPDDAGSDETVVDEPDNPTPTPTPAPPASAETGIRSLPDAAQVREYLGRYLRAGQSNVAADELGFFADHVTYYNDGTVDHAYVARDVTRYDRRWPERQFELLEPVTISREPGAPDRFKVNFRYGFHVKNPRYHVAGKADNTWTVAGATPEEWKIIAMQERRVR